MSSPEFQIADPDLITKDAVQAIITAMEDTERNVGGFVISRHAITAVCFLGFRATLPATIFGHPYIIVPDGPAMRVISNEERKTLPLSWWLPHPHLDP